MTLRKRVDVSTATVSRVFNDESGVSEETRQHVLDAAEALNYRPHASAQNLARKRTNQVAVVAPVVANYFYMHVMRGIQGVLADQDMDLMVHAPGTRRGAFMRAPIRKFSTRTWPGPFSRGATTGFCFCLCN